jgi:calcium/calmodulin-dependent protein kinase I
LLPEIRAYVARARLRRGIELVKLANRIESLRMTDEDDDSIPNDATEAAGEALGARNYTKGIGAAETPLAGSGKKSLSKIARGAIFREVVLAKVRELKEQQAQKQFEAETLSKTTSPE